MTPTPPVPPAGVAAVDVASAVADAVRQEPPAHGQAIGEASGRAARTPEAAAAVRPAERPAQPPAVVRLRYHEASGRWMVVVQDPVTGQVTETVPPEALLEVAGRLRQVLGLLMDTRS